jgi:hypothetical protein
MNRNREEIKEMSRDNIEERDKAVSFFNLI